MTCAVEPRDLKKSFNTCGLPRAGLSARICHALTVVVAALPNLAFCALIGLCAFFLESTSPVYWLCEKLSFAFGGLMLPLDLYPDPMLALGGALAVASAAFVVFERGLRRYESGNQMGLR
jgi:hypothetical protein